MTNDPYNTALEYLKDFRVKDEQYIIGVNQPGITIHKQQKRALNLFYALHLTGKITPNTTIAVIGAGIAGLTFAAAAFRSMCTVKIYETHERLLPNQFNCADRHIHPNIYDYPLEESFIEETHLPVLNWKVGPVNKFWDTVTSQFQSYQDSFESLHLNCSLTLNLKYGEMKAIHYSKDSKKYNIKTTDEKKDGFYDIVIYAIGYGLENSPNPDNPLYWNNSVINQTNLKDNRFLISGTGDGALMDVIQLGIQKHKYDELLGALKNGPNNGERLEGDLHKIRIAFFEQPTQKPDFVFSAFEQILPENYEHVINNFVFSDYDITLNGQEELRNSLNLDKVSLLNAFIVFILDKEKKFKFKKGNLIYSKQPYTCRIEGHPEDYTQDRHLVIMRHGTKLEEGINTIPNLLDAYKESDALKRQLTYSKAGLVDALWPANYFENLFSDALDGLVAQTAGHALPALETYTSVLKQNIIHILEKKNKKADFRISVHKITKLAGGTLYIRQITHFTGSKEKTSNGGFGRLYLSNRGIVGYTVQSGKPCLIRTKGNDPQFLEYLKYFNFSGPDKLKVYGSSKRAFFTFPISAPITCVLPDNTHRADSPCLVLLMDADDETFFDNKDIIDAILVATNGFIVALENNIKRKNLKMDDVTFSNYQLSNNYELNNIVNDNTFFDKSKGYSYLMKKWNDKDEYKKYRFKSFLSFSNVASSNQPLQH